MRYVVQQRLASGKWERHSEYERPGDALEERDSLRARTPDHQPWKLYRVVDLERGVIVEWEHDEVPRS